MDEKHLLRSLGLTDGEVKVYLALIELGESTITAIGRQSKVSKSKLYDILDKLIEKGFVGYFVKNSTKHFSAGDPNRIQDFLEKKKDELNVLQKEAETVIPKLSAMRLSVGTKKVAELYDGFQGLKTIREELIKTLKKGDELLVLGAPKIANERWEAWFMDFHKRRETRGVGMRIIYNHNAREYGKKRTKFERTKVRYLPNKLVSPNFIDVFKDSVFMMFVLKQPFGLVIRDESLAKSFKSYFEILWKVSKE
ncbi:hypothetical protein COV18_02710 [Candidatus Woesearchaeota archaeon CG10_big_fil_rev_8_21_14_0_10_37_12]|nr:MAG: hypothetical protein COV18_02710 [Candidatus Woesearchaeota archaeon CG10_big_fil_rev_8_21_14_0_10_37_12]